MADPRYQYEKINAIKVIIKTQTGKVLLIQEPEMNEWMPLHWGLPGGKPLINESLMGAYKRKIEGDLGREVPLKGLFKIEELLMNNRTVIMYIFISDINEEFQPVGEIASYKWATKEEIESMPVKVFTEYYNKKLLLDYFANPEKILPISTIENWDYYKMAEEPEYKEWLKSGSKENK